MTGLPAILFAEPNPAGLWTLLLIELLGLRLIHAAIFGRNWPPRLPKVLELLFGNVVFAAAGLYLLLQTWRGLRDLPAGPLWGAGLLVVYIGVAAALEYRSHRRRHYVESWPTTMATVESKEVSRVQTEKSSYNYHFVVELAYSYSVQGEFYSGYYKRPFDSEIDAWEFADSLTGKSVPIHYKPDNPAASILPDDVAASEAESLQKQRDA